ncbi:hypothetical protein Vi05172_g7871 [Venturia inaequalis]|nr:hypothetical protein Vi05172_g7871 [Venturia inaequalis]
MASHDLLGVIRGMNSAEAEGAIESHEANYAAIVVPLVCNFLSSETVFVGREEVGSIGKAM